MKPSEWRNMTPAQRGVERMELALRASFLDADFREERERLHRALRAAGINEVNA